MGGITRKNNQGNGPPTVGAVSFQTEQNLTSAQKTQAQNNIDALGYAEFDSLLDSLGDVQRDIRLVYMSAREVIEG